MFNLVVMAVALQAASSEDSRPWAHDPIVPPSSNVQIIEFGIGGESCASAMRPQERDQAEAWIFGFVSGGNEARQAGVGHSTDGLGVFAEVTRLCSTHPSYTLREAVVRVYNRLMSEQR